MLSMRFKPRRARARRRLSFGLYILILSQLLFFFPWCQFQTRVMDHELDSRTSWLNHRTRSFSVMWRGHKLRNVVVYACISTRHVFVLNSFVRTFLSCPQVFYDDRYDFLFQVPRSCTTHACLSHYGRGHFVYASFVLETYDWITALKLEPPMPTLSGRIAVLVEPRLHPLYEYTVKQVMSTLGDDWALQLYVSSHNERFVRNRFDVRPGGAGRNIVLSPLCDFGLDDMGVSGNRVQSAFSAHRALYDSIRGEYILWFQVDTIMRGKPEESWLSYSYVGSEWQGCEHPHCSTKTCNLVCGGGNSGLSLRRRSKLLLVATEGVLPQDLWGVRAPNVPGFQEDSPAAFYSDELHDNSETHWFEDDLQLSYKLSRLGLLPPSQILPRFAIGDTLPKEGLKVTMPRGMHKTWMTPEVDPIIVAQLLEEPYIHAQEMNETSRVVLHTGEN